ncbi:MAG: YfiR/HmsC family protein [Bacteroidia bacterium]
MPLKARYRYMMLLLLAGLVAGRCVAQGTVVPLDVQVALLIKATSYDRNIDKKRQPDGYLHIGVCYQEKLRASTLEMEGIVAELKKQESAAKVKVHRILLGEGQSLASHPDLPSLSVLWLTNMRGLDVAEIIDLTRKKRLLSVTTLPAWVQKGVSMGFDLQGGRPHFLIHRSASVEEGCDFSSQLLKLATVY